MFILEHRKRREKPNTNFGRCLQGQFRKSTNEFPSEDFDFQSEVSVDRPPTFSNSSYPQHQHYHSIDRATVKHIMVHNIPAT